MPFRSHIQPTEEVSPEFEWNIHSPQVANTVTCKGINNYSNFSRPSQLKLTCNVSRVPSKITPGLAVE